MLSFSSENSFQGGCEEAKAYLCALYLAYIHFCFQQKKKMVELTLTHQRLLVYFI